MLLIYILVMSNLQDSGRLGSHYERYSRINTDESNKNQYSSNDYTLLFQYNYYFLQKKIFQFFYKEFLLFLIEKYIFLQKLIIRNSGRRKNRT